MSTGTDREARDAINEFWCFEATLVLDLEIRKCTNEHIFFLSYLLFLSTRHF